MKPIFAVSLFAAFAAAAPMITGSLGHEHEVEARDGTTEFDPDFAFKTKKRDGTTEFDPDFAFRKAKRDGTTEFDPDFAFKE